MYRLQISYVDPSTKDIVFGEVHQLPGVRETFKKSMRLGTSCTLKVADLARLSNNIAMSLNEARAHVTVVQDDPTTVDEFVAAKRRADNLGTCYEVVTKAYKVMCAPINAKLHPSRVVLSCV